uniref:Uncharacterized protein n=1 Tax=Parastrongyloides trichosuri TaxID=131310 RepID=A0A0N5A6L3_PARTI
MLLFLLFFNFIFLSDITSPCGSFNCEPYSNNVAIAYEVEPSPPLSFYQYTDRYPGQQKRGSILKSYLESIATEAVNNLINRTDPAYRNFFTLTSSLNSDKSTLLRAQIVAGDCKDASGNNVNGPVAEKDTYFVQDGKLIRRVEQKVCQNGVVQSEKNLDVVIPLVYEFRATIRTGQTLCQTHWNQLVTELKTLLENTNSTVAGEIWHFKNFSKN